MAKRTALRIAAGVPMACAILGGPAAAAQPTQAQTQAIRNSCRADFQAHCAGVPTGGQAALSCLIQHEATLSPPCHQAVAAVSSAPPAAAAPAPAPPQGGAMPPRQQIYVLRQACAADYRAYCRAVPMGGGRAIGCLMDHHESLSEGCRAALAGTR